jgi:two-component system OmpR family response regulator
MPSVETKVLVVDDDKETCSLVKQYLGKHGFSVTAASGATELKQAMRRTDFDLILLDVMLPGQSGFDICRDLRRQTGVPIIMLTAVSDLTDRIVGLELGADDYIAKPFEPRELLARARAVLRRKGNPHPDSGSTASETYRFGGWTLDVVKRRLTTSDDVVISLTFAEFELLTAFARNANRPLSRGRIMELTSGRSSEVYERSVDVLISRLRRKLTTPSGEIALNSVRGVGYVLQCSVERI